MACSTSGAIWSLMLLVVSTCVLPASYTVSADMQTRLQVLPNVSRLLAARPYAAEIFHGNISMHRSIDRRRPLQAGKTS